MTRDEIIDRMGWTASAKHGMPDLLDRIERIVRAAEQAEREACAKVCEEHPDGLNMMGGHFVMCAAAIRARGEK